MARFASYTGGPTGSYACPEVPLGQRYHIRQRHSYIRDKQAADCLCEKWKFGRARIRYDDRQVEDIHPPLSNTTCRDI